MVPAAEAKTLREEAEEVVMARLGVDGGVEE